MNTFKITCPYYCFSEDCHQSIYNPARQVVSACGETAPTMKLYCPSCEHRTLSSLDIELENMAIGGGLSFTPDIAVSGNAKK